MPGQANKIPAYSNMCLNINYGPEVLKRVQAVSVEWKLKYITGQEVDFETCWRGWLKTGGQGQISAT